MNRSKLRVQLLELKWASKVWKASAGGDACRAFWFVSIVSTRLCNACHFRQVQHRWVIDQRSFNYFRLCAAAITFARWAWVVQFLLRQFFPTGRTRTLYRCWSNSSTCAASSTSTSSPSGAIRADRLWAASLRSIARPIRAENECTTPAQHATLAHAVDIPDVSARDDAGLYEENPEFE